MKKNMKKAFASLLAATMVMSMSVTAWADTADAPTESESASTTTTYTDMKTVTLTKKYNLTNSGTTSPAETFTFSDLTCTGVTDAGVGTDGKVVTKDTAPVPTIGSVKFEAGAAGDLDEDGKGIGEITITLPNYTAVGVYTYEFTENDGGTAGVTYRKNAIKLVVTVIEQAGKVRVAAIHTEAEAKDGTEVQKSDEFDNTYSAGSLAVKKDVTGEFGDEKKAFSVTVTFTAPDGDAVREAINYSDNGTAYTVSVNDWITGTDGKTTATKVIDLKKNETVTFTNIPYGVTYTVVEDDYTGDGYDIPVYDFDDDDKLIDTALDNVLITNNKGGTVDTGILLDSAPYVLLLAIAGVGAFAVATKKREEEF